MTAKKATAPAAPNLTPDQARLLEPFPPEWIGKLPRITCRACSQSQRKRCEEHTWIRCDECKGSHSSAAMHLDYVGHSDTTRRLLEVDPTWTWEPLALHPESGLPVRDEFGGLWIKLTVTVDGDRVTRLGYGDAQGKTGPNAVKEVIGDAIRNAAMRFGVALDLWAKGDRSETHDAAPTNEASQPASDEVGQQRQRRTSKKATAPKNEPDVDPEAKARADAAQASATKASKVTTLDELKGVWDGAKETGLLQTEIAHPGTSELMSLTSYITERKTELEKAS